MSQFEEAENYHKIATKKIHSTCQHRRLYDCFVFANFLLSFNYAVLGSRGLSPATAGRFRSSTSISVSREDTESHGRYASFVRVSNLSHFRVVKRHCFGVVLFAIRGKSAMLCMWPNNERGKERLVLTSFECLRSEEQRFIRCLACPIPILPISTICLIARPTAKAM